MGRPTRAQIAAAYDGIAEAFARTRERPWPEVASFGESLPPGRLVVDLGCGHGRHVEAFAVQGHRVVGLDASPRFVSIARAAIPPGAFVLGDLCRLPFRDDSFDAAIAIASIHHLPSEAERADAVREIGRVLRGGGRLLVSAWAFEQPRFEKILELHRRRGGPESGDVWVPWRVGGREVQRFYHLFVDRELPELVLRGPFRVERYFRSADNYFAVAERHG